MDGETGQLVWSETYSTLYNERLAAAAADAQGNLYVVGRAFGTGFYDILVQKYHENTGSLLWTKTIGGPAVLDDVGWDIAVDGRGRVVVCGLIGTTLGTADAVTLVLEPQLGEEIWRRHLPGAVNNVEVRAGWLAIADNDDVILGTRTWQAATGFDLLLRRYAADDGEDVWQRRWNSGGSVADDPRAMVLDAAGDVVMAGVSGGNYLVVKFDGASGAPLWHSAYSGPPNWYDLATCVAVAPDGTVVASGFSDGSGTGWDVATIGLAPHDGDLLWSLRFDAHGQSDEARAVAVGPDGGVVVTGYGYSYGSGSDLLVLYYEGDSAAPAPQPGPPAPAVLTGAWPNPFNPRVNLSFALAADGPAHLAVHDLQGRLVASLAEGMWSAGVHSASWDGRDRLGRPAPSGAYVAILRAGGQRSSLKLLLNK